MILFSLDFDCRVVVKFFGEMQWSQRVSELFMGFTTEINFLSSLGSSRRQIEVGELEQPQIFLVARVFKVMIIDNADVNI